jgi:hypothetical protein
MPISIVSADVTGVCGLGKRKVAFQVTFPCSSRTRSRIGGPVHPVYEKLQIRQRQLTNFAVPMLTGLEVPPRPRNLTSQQTASEPLKIRSVPETTAHRSLGQERRKAHRGRVHGGIHAPSCSALPP